MNYYEILQISPDASTEVIKAAYKALAKKYHPDNGIADGTEKLQALNEAYNILSDPESRKAYDFSLHRKQESEKSKTDSQKNKKFNSENPCENEEWEECYSESNGENREKSGSISKFGSAIQSALRGFSQELQRNQQIMENAYLEGLNMEEDIIVRRYKASKGYKRMGYLKALEERGLLRRNEEGELIPTERFKRLF